MIKSAEISPCGLYRYSLTRKWDVSKGTVNFIMLNPSTADAQEDDPTIRRCVGFARAWGYGGIVVTNLFAYRATNPKELKKVGDPFGPKNRWYQIDRAISADLILCAWGANGTLRDAGYHTYDALTSIAKLHVLGMTQSGNPKHPLYLRGDLEPRPWL